MCFSYTVDALVLSQLCEGSVLALLPLSMRCLCAGQTALKRAGGAHKRPPTA